MLVQILCEVVSPNTNFSTLWYLQNTAIYRMLLIPPTLTSGLIRFSTLQNPARLREVLGRNGCDTATNFA